MQELCGTRQVAAGIEPHLASTVDTGLADVLHAASLVYVASQGDDALTWVSVVSRPASSAVPLVHVLEPTLVRITGEVGSADPLCAALRRPNALVGFTVLQEWTRDRFRVMGRVTPRAPPSTGDEEGQGQEQEHEELHERQRPPPSYSVRPSDRAGAVVITFDLAPALAMGLCPKYIADRRIIGRRGPTPEPAPTTTSHSSSSTSSLALSDAALQLLAKTDTLWLGTTEPTWGSQSSHRGGMPGFIRVSARASPAAHHRLEWADYKGNSMFHSLGSALLNPLAGLLVVDYNSGDCLQLAGRLETVFAREPGTDLDGASRHVQFDVCQWRWTPYAVPFDFRTVSSSYHNPQLREAGVAAGGRSAITADAGQLGQLELACVVHEAAGVSTFRFRAYPATSALPQWLPAQYATLRLDIDGVEVERSWTITSLSSATAHDYTLDVTVKRAHDGLVSTYLHQRARPGLRLRLRGVEGVFSTPSMYWTESADGLSVVHGRPLRKLWLSAGIGITPFVAHMRCLVRFHQLHHRAGVSVPPSDILWLHVDRALDDVPRLQEMAAFLRAGRTMTNSPLTVHIVLCLTQLAEHDLHPGADEHARIKSIFGDDLDEDEGGHLPRVQVITGRPTSMTLVRSCKCPSTEPSVPVRCDDTLLCPKMVTLEDRGVDACGSVPVVALFREWCAEWKAIGVNVRNFRTESFSY